MQITISSLANMQDFANQLWDDYGKNRTSAIIFALEGPLGSGKTTFTKALASAMGIKDMVLSPTFILHEEYQGLDHIDAWRMEDPQELLNLGLTKMLAAKRVIVIEWADKVKAKIKAQKSKARIVWIKFEYGKSENERRVTYENIGDRD